MSAKAAPGPRDALLFSLANFRGLFVALAAIRAVLDRGDYDDAKKLAVIRRYVAGTIGEAGSAGR